MPVKKIKCLTKLDLKALFEKSHFPLIGFLKLGTKLNIQVLTWLKSVEKIFSSSQLSLLELVFGAKLSSLRPVAEMVHEVFFGEVSNRDCSKFSCS